MTAPSSFNVSGLLGGAAGAIDTNALVSQLMQAAALPQTQLKNQLKVQQTIESAYQAIGTNFGAMQTAAQALTDPTAWKATAASSSNAGVVATSSAGAQTGTTTFDVVALAQSQVSTVAADANGIVSSTPATGITIQTADGVSHQIALTSGSAADVAAAVNAANIGIRASVVNSDAGTVLQFNSNATGAKNGFTVVSGTDSAAQTVTAAADAKIGVGTVGAGGYVVSSATNTFTGVIPGVTFSVSAVASGVNITVASDQQSISNKVQALVTAINSAHSTIGATMSGGAVLSGNYDIQRLQQSFGSIISAGTSGGGSFKTYGIDIDKNGVASFDAKAFAAAYAAAPAGTKSVVGTSFARSFDTLSTKAIDPTQGTLTVGVTAAQAEETKLIKQINDWNDRLTMMQTSMQAKYAAMQTALAKLQSQSTYLTSMFKSMNGDSGSGSS